MRFFQKRKKITRKGYKNDVCLVVVTLDVTKEFIKCNDSYSTGIEVLWKQCMD